MGRIVFDDIQPSYTIEDVGGPDLVTLVTGWDEPFSTWFAQLYDATDPDPEAEPIKTLGYHPSERALSGARVEHGPFPVTTYDELQGHLVSWGIEVTADMRERIKDDRP